MTKLLGKHTGNARMRLTTVAVLVCSLGSGCAEYASGFVFLANSSTVGWEGSIDGVAFKQQARFEHSGRPMFRILARTAQTEGNYLLTVQSRVDGTNVKISVERGTDFPIVVKSMAYPDFIEDLSDGTEHVLDLEKLNLKARLPLKIRIVR